MAAEMTRVDWLLLGAIIAVLIVLVLLTIDRIWEGHDL